MTLLDRNSGTYLGAEELKDTADVNGCASDGVEVEPEIKESNCAENQEEDDRQFVQLLNQLGGESVFEE